MWTWTRQYRILCKFRNAEPFIIGQSGTRMKKTNNAGASLVPAGGDAVRHFAGHYRTETMDARMPMLLPSRDKNFTYVGIRLMPIRLGWIRLEMTVHLSMEVKGTVSRDIVFILKV
jgi:hypothetical protein